MRCVDRSGNAIKQNNMQNNILKFLYKNKLGRKLLKLLIKPWVSNVSGVILNSSCSRILIPLFIKNIISIWRNMRIVHTLLTMISLQERLKRVSE